MNTPVFCISLLLVFSSVAQETAPAIDWTRAKQLYQRSQRGEKLSEEDRGYLDRAKKIRRERSAGRPADLGARQRKAPDRLIPLSELGAKDRYEGQDGGLYGGGRNSPPAGHAAAALERIAQIRPLDPAGKASPEGSIVFISISMSNATQEFSRFKQVGDASDLKSRRVRIVDCAQGGQAMAEWVPIKARPWQIARQRIEAAGRSPLQVQVAWVKLANKRPTGSLKDHVGKLESDTIQVLRNARALFPNLRIVYLGSRIWAGEGRGSLNPEPYAYESAFAVRGLIQRQIEGEPGLALDSSPLLLWGPYLWAEGEKGRKGDDLVWTRNDFAGDGIHPSSSGREKVAQLLLKFCTTNPLARPWFTGPQDLPVR